MYLKKLNAEIPQETESQVIQHIKEARTLLPFLVDLPIDERIRMVKLSRKFVDFVDRALLHASANPRFFPAYLSTEEFAGNVALKSCLHRIYAEVNCLYERLKDTIMLVESEIYATSRVFYKSVKVAAQEGTEDAETIVKDLGYHYKKNLSGKTGSDEADIEPAA